VEEVMANRNVTAAVRFALIAASAAGAAIHAPATLAQEEELEQVVVTGSRILRTQVEAASPTIALSQDAFQNIGTENIADLVTTLPQFAPGFGASRTQSTFSGVASSGLNLTNLRNAGSVRTVTLINGRRVPGGTSTSTAVDFNTIPSANIERMEVITGGAAAIYGADAVAGVVNIITRKNFEGIEVGMSYGATDKGDNEGPGAYVMMGGKFADGGSALITIQYDDQGQVSCADRFICAEDFFWADPDQKIRGLAAQSGVGLGGRYFRGGGPSYAVRDGSITDANGNLIPFDVTIDGYNRNEQRDIAIPTERIMLAADLEYPVAERVTAFGELNYGQSQIDSKFEAHPFQSNRPGSQYGGGPGVPGLNPNLPIDNPFVPTALRDAVLGFNPAATEIVWWQRFAMIEDRGADSDRDTARAVGGLKGDFDSLFGLGTDWNWEVSHVWGRTKVDLGTEGLVRTDRLYYGLRVEPDPANPGQFRCIDPGARANGCIPINPFAYTPEMIAALRASSNSEGESELNDTVAWVGGTLFDLPAGGLRAIVGAEYREFSGYLDYDNYINNATTTGNQISDIDETTIRTSEVFAETLVPILKDLPFVYALNAEAAYRWSDPSSGDNYETWKFGGDWAPIQGLRFRAMQARAVRTPVPGELSGIGQTFGVVNDPCTEARRNNNPTRAANCLADGVPVGYTPPIVVEQSVGGLSGGNPNLDPEESDSFTYGLVWTPTFLPNFALTVDRFEIDIEDGITAVGRQDATNLCYDTESRLLCNVLTRGPNVLVPGANYVLNSVNEQLENIASLEISGVDVDASYLFDTGKWGRFNLQLLMTFYDKADYTPIKGEETIDYLGIAGGSTTDQGWIETTGNANIGYKIGPFSANWNMRYVGSAEMAPGSKEAGFPDIDSFLYHNLRFSLAIDTVGQGSEIYAGVTNVADEDPPFFCSGCSGTQALDTIPGYYDVFGRSYFVGMKAKF
jgi:outer membrane receptor protein involved in Fe transport